jgi:dienelactone hydrolase
LTAHSQAATGAPSGIQFEISPNPAYVDESLRIRLTGLPPDAKSVLRASTRDDDDRTWTSRAEFRADSSGCIDLATSAARSGTYRGVSPMGLFWSMHLPDEFADGRAIFAKKNVEPNRVQLIAENEGRTIASENLERLFIAPGTETRDLRIGASTLEGNGHARSQNGGGEPAEDTLVARLYLPPSPKGSRASKPLPLVIVLGGSGGGFDLDKAAVLSRHGFATLAIAYFGIPPLPTWLHRIPLDYFEAAFAWLAAQPEVDLNRLGILGVSRGAELALLLASTFPQIRAVVAFAPSSVAWAAGGREKSTGEDIPAWIYHGEAVPFAPLPLRRFMLRSAIPVVAFRRPVLFRNLFSAALRNRAAVERAAIPVENIRGPLLLISGGDDHLWPAVEMSESILARLKRNNFAHAASLLHYPRAGHMLRYPHLPTTSRASRNPHLRNAKFSYGGTPAADAEAQSDSWPRAIAFLASNL